MFLPPEEKTIIKVKASLSHSSFRYDGNIIFRKPNTGGQIHSKNASRDISAATAT
jgi:hypothetical protein